MYGIFFEDINFGADGGLYAELVENRSFEFPQQLMGWSTYGKVQVNDANPAFERNPHYVTLKESGHRDKFTGLENRGFFGMGLKKGMDYHFSVYARTVGNTRIRVELVGSDDEVLTKQQITIAGNNWKKYNVTLKSPKTDPWVWKISWRRERLPTLVVWPGEFHGMYSSRCCQESDMTE